MERSRSDDDAALVRLAQAGNDDAFGQLVSRHAPSMLSVTTRMLGHVPEAEDLAQEAFISAYKALGQFQLDATFRTWLYRITVNKCRDWLKARRPDLVPIDEGGERGAVAWATADEETPHWEFEQLELAWQIEQGIQALPPLYRESFVLKHIEGLTYDEMSEVLGAHRDTLKMRVYKARTLLCQSLAHLEGAYR
jgi:RNA polymerase sigma-70 factor (ECF subfamily)